MYDYSPMAKQIAVKLNGELNYRFYEEEKNIILTHFEYQRFIKLIIFKDEPKMVLQVDKYQPKIDDYVLGTKIIMFKDYLMNKEMTDKDWFQIHKSIVEEAIYEVEQTIK